MFLASSAKPIDSQLRAWVEQIEKQNPRFSVLAARQFRYKVRQAIADVSVTEPRHFNVLEEFILRASVELIPPPTEDELATVLGLDPVFVRNTAAELQSLQALAATSPIQLTDRGREFYEKGSLPLPPQTKQIYAIADPLHENLIFRASPLAEELADLPDLAEFVSLENAIPSLSSLTLEKLQQLIQDSGLGLHQPETGKIVTGWTIASPLQTIWQTLSIFVIFDVLEERLTLSVRRGDRILEKASTRLQHLLSQGKIFLDALCKIRPENFINQKVEVGARVEKNRQLALEIAGQNSGIIPDTGSLILLRESQIRQDFLATLNSARQNVLIHSPRTSLEVVDEEFIQQLQKLASAGVWILIGYGIAQNFPEEETLHPEIEAKLLSVKTPENLPGAQFFWLGNSHAKEIVIDRKVYLCGSYNWLDYRGDRLPLGETVYKITTRDRVEEVCDFLEKRFQDIAQKLWDEAVLNRDATLAVKPLCVWGALSMEEAALNQLEANNWLDLLPVWLKVVRQGLRSKKLSSDSACFGKALSLLNQISAEDDNIESLREEWQKVIEAIASQNRDAALSLLSDKIWTEFARLGIAQPPIDSQEKFLSKSAAAKKTPEKKSKTSGKTSSKTKSKTKK